MASMIADLVIWLMKPCLLGDQPPDTALYTLLGITDAADAGDIRKAYRRKSLALHPDKLAQRGADAARTEQAAAELERVQEAHRVLADTGLRRAYDVGGTNAVLLLDDPAGLDPPVLAANFARANPASRAPAAAAGLAAVVVPMLLPILVCAKIDGGLTTVPWSVVWAPGFVCSAAMAMHSAHKLRAVLAHRSADAAESPDGGGAATMAAALRTDARLRAAVLAFTHAALLLAAQLLLVARLSSSAASPGWLAVALPVLAREGLLLAAAYPAAFGTDDAADAEAGDAAAMHAHLRRTRSRRELYEASGAALMFVAAALKQERAPLTRGGDWWLVTLPLWCALLNRLRSAARARPFVPAAAAAVLFQMLLAVLIVAWRAGTKVTLCAAFSPVFACVALVTSCFLCAVVCASDASAGGGSGGGAGAYSRVGTGEDDVDLEDGLGLVDDGLCGGGVEKVVAGAVEEAHDID